METRRECDTNGSSTPIGFAQNHYTVQSRIGYIDTSHTNVCKNSINVLVSYPTQAFVLLISILFMTLIISGCIYYLTLAANQSKFSHLPLIKSNGGIGRNSTMHANYSAINDNANIDATSGHKKLVVESAHFNCNDMDGCNSYLNVTIQYNLTYYVFSYEKYVIQRSNDPHYDRHISLNMCKTAELCSITISFYNIDYSEYTGDAIKSTLIESLNIALHKDVHWSYDLNSSEKRQYKIRKPWLNATVYWD